MPGLTDQLYSGTLPNPLTRDVPLGATDPSGDVLTTGQVIPSAPLVLSSGQGETINNENVTTLDNTAKLIEENKANQKKLADESAAKKVEDERKAAETKALTENIATGEGSNAQGVKGTWQTNPKTGINQFFPEGSTITFDVPEPDENTALDKEKADLDAQMAALKASQDRITQALIDSITQKYEVLKDQQKEINRRAYARVETAGLRSGAMRYAPEIFSSIMSAEESAGLAKISKLESEKMSLIATAQQAKMDKDFQLLDKQIEQYNLKRKEQFELIKEQQKLQLENETKLKEARIKSDRESAIVNVISKGVKDPFEIFDALNYDKEGNKIGNISLAEISDALKLIAQPKEITPTGEYANFLSMKERGDISEELSWLEYNRRLAASKREPKAVGVPTTPGELSPLAKSIYEGTLSLKDLTPTARMQVGPELNAVGWSAVVTEEQKADFGTTRTGMDAVLEAWKGVPGKYKGYVQGTAAQILGAGKWNPEVAKFNAALGIVGMQLTRLFEKGRISDQDRVFYMSLMPNLQMNEAAAMAGATELKARLEEKLKANISEINKFISEKETNETETGRITVISPDGKEGTIPAEQLEDALKEGYKQK